MKMEERNEIKAAFRNQSVALYWLLGVVIVSFFGMQVNELNFLVNYSYSLHEILSALTNLLFLIPFALLIYLYFGMRYFRLRGFGLPKLKPAIQAIIVLTSIAAMCAISVYQLNSVTTSGVLVVNDKIKEGNTYFVILNDTKVRVTENQFNILNKNQEYLGSYQWNSMSPNKGKLLTIKPIND